MRVSSTNRRIKYLECVDSKRNIWKIRWDIKEFEGVYSYEVTYSVISW